MVRKGSLLCKGILFFNIAYVNTEKLWSFLVLKFPFNSLPKILCSDFIALTLNLILL